MKILISGATSFLGRSLIPKLQKKNCTLLLFTSNKGTFKAEKIFKKKNLKIINQSQIKKIKKFKPDIFLNLQTMYNYNTDFKNLSDLIEANFKIPLQLLMLCSNSISRLISPSTYYIYGKNINTIKPINLFAALKYSFSIVAEQQAVEKNFTYDEVILFDTFGIGDVRKKILNQIKLNFKNNKKLKLSPGNQVLDISDINEISDGFIKLIFKKKNKKNKKNIFFASSKNRLTLKQLVNKCETIKKSKLNIQWGALKYRKNEIMKPLYVKKNICIKDNLDKKLNIFLNY
jgi:nucleoside-diphosphate-sugar epimerase